jgi:ATP-dependent Clp protease ATP-binding subunit ClpB
MKGSTTMDINRFTQKSQEALGTAQTKATSFGHVEVDGEHLLWALLTQENGLVPRLLTKMDIDLGSLIRAAETELDRRPRVSGPGAEPGKIYVSQRFSRLLVAAEAEAKRLKDEYVSVEHLLMALMAEGEASPSGRLLKQYTITQDKLLAALSEVRGNQRVTSANPEETYEALEKYGRDLVKMARTDKLDPVIGRDEEIRRVIRILSRKTKNNPVLIGEPGVV